MILELMISKRTIGVKMGYLELHILVCLESCLVSKVEVDTFRELFNGFLKVLLHVRCIACILNLSQLCIYITKINLFRVNNCLIHSS